MAVTYENSFGTTVITSGTTFSYTNNGNCILVAGNFSSGSANPFTGVTYGGVALTFLGAQSGDNNTSGGVSLYGLISNSLPTGANNVVFSGATVSEWAGAISYSGADSLSTVVKAFGINSAGAGGSVSLLSTTTGGICVSVTCFGSSTAGATSTSGTKRWDEEVNSNSAAGNGWLIDANSAGGGASTSLSWTDPTSDWWGTVAVEVLPAASGATGTGGMSAKKSTADGSGTSSSTDVTGTGDLSANKATPSGTGSIPSSAAYNTGTTTTAPSVPQSTHPTLTIPAGVNDGDLMVIGVDLFGFTGDTGIAINLTPGVTGNDWTQIGGLLTEDDGSLSTHGACFVRQATADDAGSTLTFDYSGTPGTDQKWWSIGLAAYIGLDATAIDVFTDSGTFSATSVPTPTGTTTRTNEWAIYIAPATPNGSGALSTSPSGTTLRQNANTAGVALGIADTDGNVGASGTSIGGGTWTTTTSGGWYTSFTLGVQESASVSPPGTGAPSVKKPTAAGKGIVEETFSAVFDSTDANGIDTYNITASGNSSVSGSHPTRVLEPTSPSDAYPHSFLYLFPVEPDQGTTFGDPLQTAFDQGWHNQYNVTIIQPGYAADPWYADNDTDATYLQERFTLDVVDWVTANFALTGREKNYLMGFSKSGTGGAQLIFRNPEIFDVAALWDFPADWTLLSRFAETETIIGSQQNFTDNYALTPANVTRWVAASDFTSRNRIWIGGNALYGTEVDDFDALLTSLSVPHTYTYNVAESHAWNLDWMSAAIADIIPSGNGEVAGKKATASGSGSVSVTITGSGGIQVGKASAPGTGSEEFSATGDVEASKATASGSALAGAIGSGAVTASKPTVFGSGVPTELGSGSVSASKVELSGAGSINLSGSGGVTLSKASASGSGQPAFTGSGNLDGKKVSSAGTGTEQFAGTGAVDVPFVSTSGSALAGAIGAGAITVSKTALSGAGGGLFIATGNIAVAKPSLSGTGTKTDVFTGSGAILAKSISSAGNGTEQFIGSGNATSSKASVTGTGGGVFNGSGTIAANKAAASGTGTEQFTGSGNPEVAFPSLSGSGTEEFSGSGGIVVSKATIFGSGTPTEFGSAGLYTPKALLTGSGTVVPVFTGSGGISTKPVTTGAGTEEFSGSGGIAASKASTPGIANYGSRFGTGSVSCSKVTASGSGVSILSGAGGLNLKKFTGNGTGTEQFSGSGTAQLKKLGFVGISQVFGTGKVTGSTVTGKISGTTNTATVSGRA